MFRPPKITIPNARIDGSTVTGVFEWPDEVAYELTVETDAMFDSAGVSSQLSQVFLEYFKGEDVDAGEGLRQELSFDAGLGRHVCTVDARAVSSSPHQWGTDDGNPMTDATGSDVHHQAAVLDKFLNTATLDSFNPATLEVGEYSTEGVFGPIPVVPRNPNIRFDSTQESSTVDLSIDWVETRDVTEQSSSQSARE